MQPISCSTVPIYSDLECTNNPVIESKAISVDEWLSRSPGKWEIRGSSPGRISIFLISGLIFK